MNIYTRNGDFGSTTDIHGKSLSKSHTKIALQGSIDEVNSGIGYLRALIVTTANNDHSPHGLNDSDIEKLLQLSDQLKKKQRKLFEMGTDISSDFKTCHFDDRDIHELETYIDSSLEVTGTLSHFIYLSGSVPAAWCHTLRSVTRRAERDFVRHLESTNLESIPLDYKYINRLADYFFQLARHLNYLTGQEEELL